MKAYILSIAGIILLSALVTVIAPGGTMGKFVKGVMKLLCLLVFLAPLTALAKGEWEFAPAAIATDVSYLQSCEELCEQKEGESIAGYLSEQYGVNTRVEVDCDADSAFSVKNISIIIEDFGINPPENHIDIIARIENEMKSRYRCGVEVE